MRKLPLLFCFIVSVRLFAQSDSAVLVGAQWSSKKIANGVSWTHYHFINSSLFSSNQNINIIEISPCSGKLKLAIIHSDSLETTSQMAKRKKAIAGINGSFFKMRGADPDYHDSLKGVPKMEPAKLDRNRSIVYFRENNAVISENVPDKSFKRKRHQQGSIAINNGYVSIYNDDSLDLNWEHTILGQDLISTGPVMILAGIDQKIPNDAFCNDRHPRTAVGKRSDGVTLLFVVDGRANESAGMSIPELQKVMKWLGCIDAINLDGGGSTTMFVKGQPYNGVVNYPSDNKKFDHLGERQVANALLLIKD
jgi:exopolysaccharide biosynthesis protein